MSLLIDDALVAILTEFPGAWWSIDANGDARLSIEFTYYSADHDEEWSEVTVFEANASEPTAALLDCLAQARRERADSEASLAKRPSKAASE